MTSSEQVREEIARVIYESDYPDLDWATEGEMYRDEWRKNADDLLAEFPILGGVTDEMVEAGALALIRHVEGGRPPRPVSAHARELARVVLEAVIGKEQVDERG